MSAEEDPTAAEVLERLVTLGSDDANAESFLAPWHAVQWATGVCLFAVVVYAFYLKQLGDSGMDSLFKLIFRLQATQSLVNATLLLSVLTISAVNSSNGPARLLLCRLITSAGVSLNVGFVFSMLVIALVRVAYIVIPIYIHSLPKAVLQVAVATGWLVIECGFFVALFEGEVFAVPGLYYCLNLSPEGIDRPLMLAVIFPVVSACTVLAYAFILVQQLKRKVPRRRRQAQKLAILSMCIAQFLLQGLNIVPFVYFSATSQKAVYFFRVTMVYYALVESVVAPAVLMLVLRRGAAISAFLGRALPYCA